MAIIGHNLTEYATAAMGCSPQARFQLGHFRIDSGGRIQFHKQPVRKSERFKPKKNYAVFCLVGQGSGAEVSELMSRAVLLCRKEKIAKPLMDSTSLPGFQPPGISERYKLAERIASGAASLVKPAHGANQKWFRLGKCAVTVAKNRGLDAENFHAAATAVERRMKSK